MNDLSDQTVMVFDDSAARGSAIPTPSEGMVTYLKDTNQVQAYDGSAFAPLGTILQVVSTTKTDTFSASVAEAAISGDVTGLTATITPSSTSSKILVSAQVSLAVVGAVAAHGHLFRDGTAIFRADAAGNRLRATVAGVGAGAAPTVPIIFLDSPSSTSALTYSIRLSHNNDTTDTVVLNRSGGDSNLTRIARFASSITVMEVAG
jgi:hypothetical protein